MGRRDSHLEVSTDGEEITIRIGVALLAKAIEGVLFPDPETIQITDEREFAKSMISALIEEQEDGTTPVHLMLDAAAVWCMEQGLEGFGCICEADLECDCGMRH